MNSLSDNLLTSVDSVARQFSFLDRVVEMVVARLGMPITALACGGPGPGWYDCGYTCRNDSCCDNGGNRGRYHLWTAGRGCPDAVECFISCSGCGICPTAPTSWGGSY